MIEIAVRLEDWCYFVLNFNTMCNTYNMSVVRYSPSFCVYCSKSHTALTGSRAVQPSRHCWINGTHDVGQTDKNKNTLSCPEWHSPCYCVTKWKRNLCAAPLRHWTTVNKAVQKYFPTVLNPAQHSTFKDLQTHYSLWKLRMDIYFPWQFQFQVPFSLEIL